MTKRSIVVLLILTVILIILGYYSQLPITTVQTILAVGLLHGILEWFPVDPFGRIPMYAYSLLGFSGSTFEVLITYLRLGSILAVLIKLLEDFMGVARMVLAKEWHRLVASLPLVDISKILVGLVAVYFSSYALSGVGLFQSFQVQLTTLYGQLTNLVLGIALIVVGITSRRINKGVKESQAGILVKLNLGQLIVAGLMIGTLSLPGVNSGPAGFAVLTIGGLQPTLGLRIQYVMMLPLFVRTVIQPYSGTIILPAGLNAIQTVLLVFAVAYFGYITLSIIIGIASRIGASEICIIFGSILLIVFAAQYRFYEGISRMLDTLARATFPK